MKDRILDWLRDEPGFFGKISLFISVICLNFAWCVSILLLFPGLVEKLPKLMEGVNISGILLFLVLPFAAFCEEVIFRFLPIMILFFILNLLKIKKTETESVFWPLVLVVITSSILFGYAHGSVYNIIIQGFAGILFCAVFLKCGGINGKLLKGLFCSSLCHYLFNFICCLPSFLG